MSTPERAIHVANPPEVQCVSDRRDYCKNGRHITPDVLLAVTKLFKRSGDPEPEHDAGKSSRFPSVWSGATISNKSDLFHPCRNLIALLLRIATPSGGRNA